MKRIEAGTAVMQGRLLSNLCSLSQGKKWEEIMRKDYGKKI